jgi:hypothetical protein
MASDKCPACGPNPLEELPYYVEMCGEVGSIILEAHIFTKMKKISGHSS